MDIQVVEHGTQLANVMIQRRVSWRRSTLTVPQQVNTNQTVTALETGNERPPHGPIEPQAVQTDDRDASTYVKVASPVGSQIVV